MNISFPKTNEIQSNKTSFKTSSGTSNPLNHQNESNLMEITTFKSIQYSNNSERSSGDSGDDYIMFDEQADLYT